MDLFRRYGLSLQQETGTLQNSALIRDTCLRLKMPKAGASPLPMFHGALKTAKD